MPAEITTAGFKGSWGGSGTETDVNLSDTYHAQSTELKLTSMEKVSVVCVDRGEVVSVDPIAARMEKNLSLKKRMIRLSNELEDFYNNKEKNAPSPTYYNVDGIDREKQPEHWVAEVAKQQEASRKAYVIYGSETATLYASLFRMRVLAICSEATDAGLNIDGLDKAEVADLHGFDSISHRLAALADKL